MQKEYIFYDNIGLDFPLSEEIELVKVASKGEYLVSNHPEAEAIIYAPEINFYLKQSNDTIAQKINNVTKLYAMRALGFDFAQDMDYSQEVGGKVLIVSEDASHEALKEELREDDFTVMLLSPSMILDVNGHIGDLHVTLKKEDELLELECDQIIWWNAPSFAMKQSGVYDPALLGLEGALKKLRDNKGEYHYKNYINYDPSICQYHERREEICGKCAEVCPTVAILKEDETKHLVFSHIDCHGCGGCISVCPSGALDYTQMPRIAFSHLCAYFKGATALIIPHKMDLGLIDIPLYEGVLPLMIEGEKYLHEAHLMTLLQTSGNPIIFYTDFISKGTGDVIRMINEIFERKYHKKAIYVCEDTADLARIFETMESFPECMYGINEDGLRKREIFSARLAHLVGDEDLGVVKAGEHVHYGDIKIDESKCTLCLSCVGACNVRALTAHPEDNSLRFNASICTNCTYCEVTCPEQECLTVVRDEISLKPSWFSQRIMAKDELFTCLECGMPFATVKAVEKIAAVMTPLFGNDEVKLRTLYCCAACKPKVMFKAHMENEMKGMNV
ncbi:4Fe-4S binding protein [Sulfurospirillum diekertiae]|uniref:4Fe-4S binding protein n=1 Tax=Sulfurospirillum diekertiae TaxID=1854492 RepID=A0A6G9VSL6_9BACT|nr:4Fe-4S binding protein [Sulfurospirillum diekertiae]QIR75754.1 4Fe-4S binding protein [Sulfurospirillum diekertiae]QIR78400.1 4Fe-4S binding protein [Sulfurospirillum diekertiae]